MDTNKAKTELLRGVLAPWDEKAWEGFRELYPEEAATLLDAVGSGVTADDIRDFCAAEGYSERVANWLAHAATHVGRTYPAPIEAEAGEVSGLLPADGEAAKAAESERLLRVMAGAAAE